MMAPVRPSTRPRYSGSTLVWIRAMNTELKKGADRPISRDRPANARKPEGGQQAGQHQGEPQSQHCRRHGDDFVPGTSPQAQEHRSGQHSGRKQGFHQSGSGGVPSEILHAH